MGLAQLMKGVQKAERSREKVKSEQGIKEKVKSEQDIKEKVKRKQDGKVRKVTTIVKTKGEPDEVTVERVPRLSLVPESSPKSLPISKKKRRGHKGKGIPTSLKM